MKIFRSATGERAPRWLSLKCEPHSASQGLREVCSHPLMLWHKEKHKRCVSVGKNAKKCVDLRCQLLDKLEFDQLNREISTTTSSDVTVIIVIRLYVVLEKYFLCLLLDLLRSNKRNSCCITILCSNDFFRRPSKNILVPLIDGVIIKFSCGSDFSL